MDKFSFIDPSTKERWDFEILEASVKIGLPNHKVEHTTPVDFDPKVEFEGNQDLWIEWAADVLIEADVVVFDEWRGLLTHEELAEAKQEEGFEREHVRQESDPWKYLH